MKVRLVLAFLTSLCVAGGVWLSSEPVAAQAGPAARRPSTIPRLPDGKPDLQGTFDVGEGKYHVDWLMRDRLERGDRIAEERFFYDPAQVAARLETPPTS